MIEFTHIDLLWLLSIVPVVLIGLLIISYNRKKKLKHFADNNLLEILQPDYSKSKNWVKWSFVLFAAVVLIFALADPREGTKLEKVKKEGIDLMICLDVSNSMKAEDLTPNRLENAKRSIEQLIDKLRGDRVGLIVFGGEAYPQLPITTDYAAARMLLKNVDTDIIPTQGTAIGTAIDMSVESFPKTSKNKKVIVIITDGENHEDDAIKAAQNAKEDLGIITYTIGMGTPEGTPIPEFVNGRRIGFKKDNAGSTVVTKLNENLLQEIASAGGGAYIRATNYGGALNAIFNELKKIDQKIDKTTYETKMFSEYEHQYQPFVFIVIMLLILETLLSTKKSSWLKKLGLIN
jgi:Ca-activated chloride channel homolog